MKLRCLLFSLVAVLVAIPALAHEVRPAYLELRQRSATDYEAFWKVPGSGQDLRLGLYVKLPVACRNVTEPRAAMARAAYTERWSIHCDGGLAQQSIEIAGLGATMTDVLVRVERLDGSAQVARLTPAAASFVVEAVPDAFQVSRTYLGLGVRHILQGVDHLLFVAALMLLVKGTRRLVATVTAFTVAHSLTLAGATLGLVHVPGPPVEAVIALSIVFVAAEIVRDRDGTAGLSARWPWLVAFAFGLLHGFGFAGALSEVGLPPAAIPLALVFFNVGVELGQLLFIGAAISAAVLLRRIVRRSGRRLPPWSWRIPPYAIGTLGMFWVLQRIAAF